MKRNIYQVMVNDLVKHENGYSFNTSHIAKEERLYIIIYAINRYLSTYIQNAINLKRNTIKSYA